MISVAQIMFYRFQIENFKKWNCWFPSGPTHKKYTFFYALYFGGRNQNPAQIETKNNTIQKPKTEPNRNQKPPNIETKFGPPRNQNLIGPKYNPDPRPTPAKCNFALVLQWDLAITPKFVEHARPQILKFTWTKIWTRGNQNLIPYRNKKRTRIETKNELE